MNASASPLLEAAVLDLARTRGVTLATAESCTGGLIAHRLTNIPGSSEVFRCGWVVYSNDAKTRELGVGAALINTHGAVSGEVAAAMAAGALHQSAADFAVAVTGIAGPGGGTAEKPVGTVWLARARKGGGTPETIHHVLPGDREAFKARAADKALEMLLQALSS